MRYTRICIAAIVLTASLLLFTGCTKHEIESSGDGDKNSPVLNIFSAGADAINTLLEYGKAHKTDPVTALYAIVDSIKKFPGVEAAQAEDSSCLAITMKSGLKTMLTLNFLNDDGSSMFRGGGGGYDKPEGPTTDESERIVVKNKRILFYSPPFDEFYTGKQKDQDKVLEQIAVNSGLGITFERVTGYAPKLSVLKTFGDYGMVIMSTHGVQFGFVAGALKLPDFYGSVRQPNGVYKIIRDKVKTEADLKTLISANNDAGIYEGLLNGDMVTTFSITIKKNLDPDEWVNNVNFYIGNDAKQPAYLVVTTKYMETLPSLDSTIIFGNMCYSGATNSGKPFMSNGASGGYLAIRDAMMKKKPGAYYCYVSAKASGGLPVINSDAITSEQSLLKSLLQDMDTTGNAHKTDAGKPIIVRSNELPSRNIPLELTLFGQDNIWYGCGSGQFTDERDGNVYKTVCINGKEWMAENLRYNATGSVVYNNDASKAAKFGRLYSWEIVMNGQAPSDAVPSGVRGICPKGWHIPSAAEFDKVIAALGGLNVAGGKMKATTDWNTPGYGTNESGLNILPAGDYNPGANFGYSSLGRFTYIRSSSSPVKGGVWTYRIGDESVVVWKTNYSTNSSYGDPWYYSCRCAKD